MYCRDSACCDLVCHVQDQADALLQPVLKQYEEKEKQLRLDAFWTVTHRFAKIRSKRLQAAISTSLGRDLPQEMLMTVADHPPDAAPDKKVAKKASASGMGANNNSQKRGTRASKSGSAGEGPRSLAAKMSGGKPAPAQDSEDEEEEEDKSDDDDDDDDEYPADQPRCDLPPADPDDFGGLDMGMDSYRAQFFY